MTDAEELLVQVEGSLTPFGGLGIGVAVLLLLGLRAVTKRHERRLLRAPTYLLVTHLALILLRGLLPKPEGEGFAILADRGLALTALSLLLLGIARTSYLILSATLLQRGRGRTLPGIFRDIIQVAFYALVALFVLHAAGVEPGSLLTTSALLTAVIGLSLQDTLGNLFAGLAIQTQEPFEVGDWIQFDDDPRNVGEVLEINWRAARLLTVERFELTVPNSLLAKAPIRNYSKPTPLVRRAIAFVAPYEAPPARVHRIIVEAVTEVPGVAHEPAPDVQTRGFSERGVDYHVRYFIERFEARERIDSEVRDRVWYALRRAALPIPAPQRRVTLREQTLASAERDSQARVNDVEKALAKVPLFQPLEGPLLHELALHTERRLYAPAELVIQQGDYGEELFVVERGAAEVLVDSHAGLEHVASLGPSDFFGEMSLMTGERRRATVRAETELALLVVSKDALSPLLEASPELAVAIGEQLAVRGEDLDRHTHAADSPCADAAKDKRGEMLERIRQFFSL